MNVVLHFSKSQQLLRLLIFSLLWSFGVLKNLDFSFRYSCCYENKEIEQKLEEWGWENRLKSLCQRQGLTEVDPVWVGGDSVYAQMARWPSAGSQLMAGSQLIACSHVSSRNTEHVGADAEKWMGCLWESAGFHSKVWFSQRIRNGEQNWESGAGDLERKIRKWDRTNHGKCKTVVMSHSGLKLALPGMNLQGQFCLQNWVHFLICALYRDVSNEETGDLMLWRSQNVQ